MEDGGGGKPRTSRTQSQPRIPTQTKSVKSKRKFKTPNSQTLSIVVFAARTPLEGGRDKLGTVEGCSPKSTCQMMKSKSSEKNSEGCVNEPASSLCAREPSHQISHQSNSGVGGRVHVRRIAAADISAGCVSSVAAGWCCAGAGAGAAGCSTAAAADGAVAVAAAAAAPSPPLPLSTGACA